MPQPTESPTTFTLCLLLPFLPKAWADGWLTHATSGAEIPSSCPCPTAPVLLDRSSLALMPYPELEEDPKGRGQLPGETVAFHDLSSNWRLWRHIPGTDGFSFCPLKGNSGMHNVLHKNKTQMPCSEKSDPTNLKITDEEKSLC